jgi:hypothetical protein
MTFIFLTFSGLEAAGSLGQAIVKAGVRFETRSWAWMMFPFLNCVGTALTCYLFGNSRLRWKTLSAIGAAAWAGWFLVSGLFPISLVKDYQTEKLPILITMGVLGIVFNEFRYQRLQGAACSLGHSYDADGSFLYGAERKTSMLIGYKIDPDKGTLTQIGRFPTEKTPRGFAIETRGKFLLSVCASGLGDAERFERPKEICVFLGRHHADEATEAKPGRERVGGGERRAEQNQETVEKAMVLDEIARHHRIGHG